MRKYMNTRLYGMRKYMKHAPTDTTYGEGDAECLGNERPEADHTRQVVAIEYRLDLCPHPRPSTLDHQPYTGYPRPLSTDPDLCPDPSA